MKKKILLSLGLGLLALLIIGVVVIRFYLGDLVKTGMETMGPKMTQTTLKVESVSIALRGAASVTGLELGNPAGYKTAAAIRVGHAAISLAPGSLLADKIVIHSIVMRGPEITFEGNPFGDNNLKKIMANVNLALGSGGPADTNAAAKTEGAGKKLQVDDILIAGAKVHVRLTGLGGKEMDLVLPDIHLTGLGQGPAGISAGALTQELLSEVNLATIKAVAVAVTDLGKNVGELGKEAGKALGGNVEKMKKGLGGLFGK